MRWAIFLKICGSTSVQFWAESLSIAQFSDFTQFFQRLEQFILQVNLPYYMQFKQL